MKVYKSGRALMFASVLALTACDVNVNNDIKPYVEAPVALKATSAAPNVFKGSIPFTETHYFTAYRTECDTVQCGTDTREVCQDVPRCTSVPQSCSTDSVCEDVPDSVCHTDSSGQQQCTSTTRRECHDVERCTGGGESCTSDSVCHTEEVPRYCQENCRDVPYEDSTQIDHSSPVTVTVTGGDAKAINTLVLGVETTSAYTSIFQNASSKPKEIETILKTLAAADKTLIAMQAKGLVLVDTSSPLSLPAGFKAGDPVTIDLKVQSGGDKAGVSALGTTVEFPALRWSTQE